MDGEKLETVPNNSSQIVPDVKDVLVTVIVTHYNYSGVVENALKSVLMQSHANFECVIIDDCSDAEHIIALREIISRLADSRLKLLELQENRGQTFAVFEALKHSSGEFVSLLDPDDLYDPLFIEKMLKCHLNPRTSAAVAACEMALFRIGGAMLSKSYVGFKNDAITSNELPKYEASLYDFGFSKYYPPETTGWIWATTSSLMFRRDALEILRRDSYMPDLKICADTFCVIGSHLLGGTLFIDEPLAWRGIHKNNAVESEKYFSSLQRRHKPEFVDPTESIKLLVTKTIIENDCLQYVAAGQFFKTLKSHFHANTIKALLADHPKLAIALVSEANLISTAI